MLPLGDKTPEDWTLPSSSFSERLKRQIRKIVYPLYLRLINPFLRRRFDPSRQLNADQWYWGHRGLEYELLRARLDRLAGITDKSVLVAGCGTGRDMPSWFEYRPKQVLGVDYFSYDRAWTALRDKYSALTEASFVQGDLADLKEIPDESFDLIGSDAVFEHLQNLPEVLRELHRVLKNGGAIYATFGPLWYSWGGDHVSGYDDVRNGYNHLLLPPDDYKKYLSAYGAFSHSEHDGRTWVEHELFSYLRPSEYLAALEAAGFRKMHLGIVIDPRAIHCLREYPEIRQHLKDVSEMDLRISAMTLIYRKV